MGEQWEGWYCVSIMFITFVALLKNVAGPDILMLGALAMVPMASGLEVCIAKTYLLFQELYGHAGVAHRGRNFGPAPFLVHALGIELRAEDHQRHHIKASCNFSKRFSFFDQLLGTWDDGRKHK